KLQQAMQQQNLLTKRQEEEIHFYMKDYRLELTDNTTGVKPLNIFPEHEHLSTAVDPLSFTYRDSLFALSIRPAWSMESYFNKNEFAFTNGIGLEGFGYYGKHLGVYARYSHHYENTTLSSPGFFSRRPGGVINEHSDGSQAYNDISWGIMYSWKWGALGLVKDRPEWGNNYYGAGILSGKTPSFTQIRLQLTPVRWFEFNYLHGWLGSDVIDSSRSWWDGNSYQEVMRPKYIAANMFTITPIPHLNISVGNSIIYSDAGVQAAYLVPFLFFRLADYELGGMSDDASSNSQIFFDISSRNIRHLHLYFSIFADEISIYRIGDPTRHNFLGYKGGFRLSNWPVQDLSLTTEYTYTLPGVYRHFISTTTFESDSYTLGHYMRDNSHELFLALLYKPIRGLQVELSYNFAQHGNDYLHEKGSHADENPMLEEITWQKSIIGLKANYAILSNASIFAAIYYSDIRGYEVDGQSAEYYLSRYTPEMFWNETFTANFGFRIGL
ncbi:MAG: capsule assembly Wzi family protein, partial [Bacteroidota bacterium]